MPDTRKSPPTPTQLQALATFAASGQMTTDNRVINALIRRDLLVRTGDNAYALTDAGRALAKSRAGRSAAASMKCIVDGCHGNVFGPHNMCAHHLTRWLDGRLRPKSQGAA